MRCSCTFFESLRLDLTEDLNVNINETEAPRLTLHFGRAHNRFCD